MAQAAYNTTMSITAGVWTLISEVGCTFVAMTEEIEVIGATETPATSVQGVRYPIGSGEDASTGTLARYPGAGTATGIYVMSRYRDAQVFVSREAVA